MCYARPRSCQAPILWKGLPGNVTNGNESLVSFSDNLYALNEAMKSLQGGQIPDRFSTWLCRVSYSEGKGIRATAEKSDYEVEFSFDENNSRVSLAAFDGLNRHADYPSRLPGVTIKFDENDTVLTITGKSQRTSKAYELNIFLLGAKRVR
jgi:hypothetical protein